MIVLWTTLFEDRRHSVGLWWPGAERGVASPLPEGTVSRNQVPEHDGILMGNGTICGRRADVTWRRISEDELVLVGDLVRVIRF